jgi:putative zinc finger/helix-turn-helix YgiT family protein
MEARPTNVAATVKGEQFQVACKAMVCNRCGFQVLDANQSDEYSIASADAYRTRHGLLTTTEIRRYRRNLKMSQEEFAKYLRVGVASVKRWELGQIQDDAMDELIRVKCDRQHCKSTLAQLDDMAEEATTKAFLIGHVMVMPGTYRGYYEKDTSSEAWAEAAKWIPPVPVGGN